MKSQTFNDCSKPEFHEVLNLRGCTSDMACERDARTDINWLVS